MENNNTGKKYLLAREQKLREEEKRLNTSIQLHKEEAGTILYLVARKINKLLARSLWPEIFLPLHDKATNFLINGRIERNSSGRNELNTISVLGIPPKKQFTEVHLLGNALCHLLYAWQELNQKPVPNRKYIESIDVNAACAKKVNLHSILESIYEYASAEGKLQTAVMVALESDQNDDYTETMIKYRKAKKSPKNAIKKRWGDIDDRYLPALDIIKTSIYQGKHSEWFHSDFVNWILETYEDDKGSNPFKTVKDKNQKTTQQGLSKTELLKKVAKMFREMKIPHRIKGEKKS